MRRIHCCARATARFDTERDFLNGEIIISTTYKCEGFFCKSSKSILRFEATFRGEASSAQNTSTRHSVDTSWKAFRSVRLRNKRKEILVLQDRDFLYKCRYLRLFVLARAEDRWLFFLTFRTYLSLYAFLFALITQ